MESVAWDYEPHPERRVIKWRLQWAGVFAGLAFCLPLLGRSFADLVLVHPRVLSYVATVAAVVLALSYRRQFHSRSTQLITAVTGVLLLLYLIAFPWDQDFWIIASEFSPDLYAGAKVSRFILTSMPLIGLAIAASPLAPERYAGVGIRHLLLDPAEDQCEEAGIVSPSCWALQKTRGTSTNCWSPLLFAGYAHLPAVGVILWAGSRLPDFTSITPRRSLVGQCPAREVKILRLLTRMNVTRYRVCVRHQRHQDHGDYAPMREQRRQKGCLGETEQEDSCSHQDERERLPRSKAIDNSRHHNDTD